MERFTSTKYIQMNNTFKFKELPIYLKYASMCFKIVSGKEYFRISYDGFEHEQNKVKGKRMIELLLNDPDYIESTEQEWNAALQALKDKYSYFMMYNGLDNDGYKLQEPPEDMSSASFKYDELKEALGFNEEEINPFKSDEMGNHT